MIYERIRIKQVFLLILLTGLFFFSNLISLDLYNLHEKVEDGWIVMLIISLIVLPFTIIYKYNLTKKKLILLFLWELFISSVLISKLLNNEFVQIEFLFYLIIVPLVFFNKGIMEYKNTFLAAAVLSVLPLLTILQPWNRLAILISVISITLIGFIILKNPFIKTTYLIGLLLIIFITTHRTSLLTFLIIVSATLLLRVFARKTSSFVDLLKRLVVTGVIIGVAFILYDNIFNAFLYKREISGVVDLNSISAGRVDMWVETLKNGITLFGNGEAYFTNTFDLYHAHNIIVQITGAYGIISLILFLLLIGFLFKEVYRNRDKHKYIYFFSAYFLIGMTEYILFINTYFIYPSILFFAFMGTLINEETQPRKNPKVEYTN
ncbi:O-antigen ligase family protein [Lentibacillus sp. CBA3610]|uniref:O-antigen ligase family protein n=1 Tax=Lentibacillus sp. CBA3610 TaxID=2518176 RepID=UPI001595A3A8|nr:O-antigen ligase family protein [Lentibacillus sp. CBA3610]QKY70301.1 hypothetical protein Len3610_12485 [Lentibacillus sp. CBA3610]